MLKKSLLLMTLFLAMFGAARATEVEIGELEGAVNNSYLPMNSLYNYSYTQQIYTAGEIGMAGTINSITMYLVGNANLYEMPFDIYMVETDKDAFTSTSDWVTLTASDIVYSGSVTVHNTEAEAYTFDLTTPFVYSGQGNLLIAFNNSTGQWKSGLNGLVFGADTDPVRAIYARQDSNGYDPTNPTFTAYGTSYQKNVIVLDITGGSGPTCDKPSTFEVSNVTAHGADFAWTSTVGNYKLEYKKAADEDWTVVSTTENTYTLSGLTQNTAYNARVKAVCGTDSESGYRAANFTTEIACPAPTGLTVTLTPGDGTVAEFSWTETGTATTWQLCLNDDETNLIDMDSNPYTHHRLTAEQTYTAKVRAYCNNIDQSSWSNTITFTPTDAYNFTVNDGTTTNVYVPIYGNWVDNITKSQFIIPATDLEVMQYGTIQKLTFYSSNASVNWGAATFEVYMTETTETTLSELADYGTMEKVKNEGSLTISGNKMEVTLDSPYQYMGENLMIGFLQTTSGSYVNCNWYGVTANGASMGGYGTSISQRNFLPKTTIDYIPGEAPACAKPTGLAVNYESGLTAVVSWNSEATAWNINVNGNVTTITENPYTLTRLELATNYEVSIQANCGGSTSEWTNPVSFTTDMCMPADQCELTFELTDSYGDGWNGAYIDVVDVATGASLAHMSNQNASKAEQQGPKGTKADPKASETETYTLAVCDGREIQFVWHSGNYDSECSYVVKDVNDEEIFSGSGAMSAPVDYTVSCTVSTCKKPTDLAVSEIGGHSAKLSWTENGEATAWIVAYKSSEEEEFTEVEAEENPFVLRDLRPETPYTVKVKASCGSGEESNYSSTETFTTDIACSAPQNLVVNDITPLQATVSWAGEVSSYNLRYRELTAADFVTVTLTADDVWGDGSGYQMLLDADANTYGTIIPTSGGLTTSGDASAAVYAEFEYKIPVNADGAMSTTNIVCASSVAIQIPVGTYDWCITNPTPGDRIWIASSNGNVGGRYNDFEFEAGKTYEFYVSFGGTNDQVDVTITDNSKGELRDAEWTLIEGVTSPYTIQVEPEKDYTVEVQSDCGEDGTSTWTSVSFSTPSNCQVPTPLDVTEITAHTATLNWSGILENYEARYRTPASREELYFENFDDQPSTWTLTNTEWKSGSSTSTDYWAALGYGYTETAYLISPELPESERGSYVEFEQKYVGDETTFQVGYSSTENDVDAFTWGDEIPATALFFTPYNEMIPEGTKYIAIKSTSSASESSVYVNNFGIYGNVIPAGDWNTVVVNGTSCPITDLIANTKYEWQVRGESRTCEGGYTEWCELHDFTTLPSCLTPTDLAYDDVTPVSAIVSWESDAEVFDIDLNGTIIEGVTNQYTLALEPATSYTVKVRANCGGGDYSEWSSPMTFNSQCLAFELPYAYGFETDEIMCWYGYSENTNNSFGILTSANAGFEAYEGDKMFVFGSYNSASSYNQVLITPELITDEPVAVEFYYRTVNGGGSGETFKVGYSPTTDDFEEFVWDEEISTTTTEWTKYYNVFPADTKFVAVHYYSNYQYYLVVDAFRFGSSTITQTTELVGNGAWNRFGLTIEVDDPVNMLQALETALGDEEGFIIETEAGNTESYGDGFWWGTIDDIGITNEEMIFIYVPENVEGVTVELVGAPADPANHPITITNAAYTRIGYPFTEEMPVEAALADFEAVDGDVIEAPNGDATYFDGFGWFATFDNFVPGEGYMFNSASTEVRTLIFSTIIPRTRSTVNLMKAKIFKASVPTQDNSVKTKANDASMHLDTIKK